VKLSKIFEQVALTILRIQAPPDRFPIHWNIRGEVDGYAGKTGGAFFLPMFNAVMAALTAVLPRLDPKCRSYDPETRASPLRHYSRLIFLLQLPRRKGNRIQG
jgi:uncharacterized membrane protein